MPYARALKELVRKITGKKTKPSLKAMQEPPVIYDKQGLPTGKRKKKKYK